MPALPRILATRASMKGHKFGVAGEKFDPNLHEAVMRQPTNDHPEDTVIEEMMRGYLLGDRVLRHAMVKVATAAEETTSAPSDEEA